MSQEGALAERVVEAKRAGEENEDSGVKNLTENEGVSFADVRNKKISELTQEEKVYRMVGKSAPIFRKIVHPFGNIRFYLL